MNIKQIIIKNTGLQMVSQLISVAAALVLTIVLSRYLGVEGFGTLNYVLAYYFFFLTLSDFGVDTVVVRECSHEREKAGEIIGAMLCYKLIIALISVGIAWTVIGLVDYAENLKQLLRCYALILPLVSLQLPSAIFRVLLKMEYPSALGIFKSLVNLSLVLLAIRAESGLLTILFLYVVTEAAMLVAVLLTTRKYVKLVLKIDRILWKRVLRSSIPLGISALFVAVIQRADFIMLERMGDLSAVGLYSAAYRVKNLLEMLPIVMMATIFPLMSRYAKEDQGLLKRLYHKSLGFFSGFALVIGIGITMGAALIVRILYGSQFAATSTGLRVLVWSTVATYIAITGGNLLVSIHREKLNMIFLAIAALLNIILNFLWIPTMGFVGAALATSVASGVSCLCVVISSEFALKKLGKID